MTPSRSRVGGWLLGTALATVVVSGTAAAQSAPSTPQAAAPLPAFRHRLLGAFDLQTGDPIEGAEVIDVFSHTTALTTKTGTVSLVFLPEGGSMLRIQKLGFEPKIQMVVISPDDTVPLTVLLSKVAQTLPTVVTKDSAPHFTSPGLRGFEERRKAGGGGHFIDETEMRKHDTEKITSLVRRFPGMTVTCPRSNPMHNECYAVSTRIASKLGFLGGRCDVDLYVNGSAATDNDLEKLRADEYAAIEYYGGGASIPMQYNKTGSSCGVILLWLRER